MKEKSPRLLLLPPTHQSSPGAWRLGMGWGRVCSQLCGCTGISLHPEISLQPDESRAVIFQQYPLIWSAARSRARQFKGGWAAAGSWQHSCPISAGHSTTWRRGAEDLKPSVPLKNLHSETLLDTVRNKKGWELCRGMERARYEGEVLLLMCQRYFSALTLK